MEKKRLDQLLFDRGLAESREKAHALILAGQVQVDGQRRDKPGHTVAVSARIEVGQRMPYASRGGFKLAAALDHFLVDPTGMECLDVGASTGGFTDCLLQSGASRVYAVDVNVSQLAWKLQQDPRVLRVERNARELRREDVPEPVTLVAADVSFISVAKVLTPACSVASPGADFVILVKPQFELRKQDVSPGGIVLDTALHEKAIEKARQAAEAAGLECIGVHPSCLLGAEGNQEYFLHARKRP